MTTERDAELSALLDGALSAADEAALREELARDGALAARFAELAQVDDALRALPARPVPVDLRARLQAKLAAEAPPARPQLTAIPGGAPARPSRRRWLGGISAAVAAAAAAVLVVVNDPVDRAIRGPGGDSAATRAPEQAPERVAARDPVAESARPVAPESALLPGGSPDPARLAAAESAPALPEAAPTEAPREVVADAPVLAAGAETLAMAPHPGAAATLPETAPAPQLAAASVPALTIEATDAEADALAALEPNDASVVAVLELLDALDALEAEAS